MEAAIEQKLKHLEFTLGVVDRLASASFQMKGWSVVLVSALLVLVAQAGRVELGVVLVVPIVVFWALDGYFLCQERLVRKLYDRVRQLCEEEIDFSMDVGVFRSAGRFGRLRDWWSAAWSVTLWPFYGTLAFLSALVGGVVQHLGSGK